MTRGALQLGGTVIFVLLERTESGARGSAWTVDETIDSVTAPDMREAWACLAHTVGAYVAKREKAVADV